MTEGTENSSEPSNTEWRAIEPDAEEAQIDEYDLTTSPNDFNVLTIYTFVKSGSVVIPGFQRNYVWDKKRASRLIESLIIGLPVPQVFLYEEDRNRFLVIDGQQRLMTVYYFMAGRFPRRDKRSELREIFANEGDIPDSILHDDDYFEPFNLQLPASGQGVANKFSRLNYQTLGDHKTQFEMRTIRNMIVKQLRPSGDTSSIYEMFNRLNTGGVLLTPQEIRSSLFHSAFYDALYKWNMDPRWRGLLGQEHPDLHMRDIEVMLRAFAMARSIDTYTPSMVKFLNRFSKSAQQDGSEGIEKFGHDLNWFLAEIASVPRSVWLTRQQKFQVNLFESVFAAAVRAHYDQALVRLDAERISMIRDHPEYVRHSQERTTDTENVKGRFRAAYEVLTS
ncbi:Uncharacterized conserved protein [Mycobacteroides abscessus subsp. abscessus]|uniref:DUF262 domain-containing protein n=1 Tax=Mycobacteroides abscessus TaxID=36809 RepID=A0ABD7HNC8_9MYCO|nr:DUF262 domain-containing protein [Mycobacteroides abscessus]PVA30936.1 DUF262 domain-containing protein [Mycobacteroides abscessus]PVA49846.1 DUF262 domain-containing protein [Mycobacteroides abscessus]RIQ88878.1 DUF262 domain-containing protein [Mycobacteroides abscessus]RIR01106.1 DUF262 domain-containing protein [Mycobacteroides abscessus]RIR40562.1 DUF262 domain-containing protein [Mycobacteroides abscessus]